MLGGMKTISKEVKELELSFIKLSFSHLRLKKPATWQRLSHSISRYGQQVPVIVVPDPAGQPGWILIDGYLRVGALRQCGNEIVKAEIWESDPQYGLLCLLKGLQQRPWEAIEEAYLMKELIIQSGCSQQELAHQIGRDPSFIHRRLQLLSDNSDEILAGVRAGYLSPWSASRILAPLARANLKHATQLMSYLESHHHSTRQLQQFYQHYQKSNKAVRERMITHPDLFFKSLEEEVKNKSALQLAKGPEGEWQQSLAMISGYLKRLEKLVDTLFSTYQPEHQQQLLDHLTECDQYFSHLNQQIRKTLPCYPSRLKN
jgi:ParB family transcriptional regulator, chromosome partitioning protein